MPRRKPASAKQRKVQLQDRRALKRGDIDQLPVKPKASRRGATLSTNAESSSRRLESRFISVTPAYLALTRDLAHNVSLIRPIPASSAAFPIDILTARGQEGKLTCPARPKFRFEQSKKELEMNEQGMFKKWLVGVEGVMKAWVEGDVEDEARDPAVLRDEESEERDQKWPRSPSWFETNLEVWRQL